MDMVKAGVIGVGVMGERHARVYATLRNVELIGVSDLNKERGRAVARTYDTAFYEDYQKLLKEVDAISIVTTTPIHFKLCMEALEAGVHVLVEKPITETVEQGKQLVQAARESGLVLQVGHIERFNPAYIELKNVTENMKIIAVNMRRLSPFDTSNTDVDVIRDLMIHDLDLVLDLVGHSLQGFSAWGRSIHSNAIDHATVTLSFRDGPMASIFASRITENKVRAIEVTAQGAYVEADLLSKSIQIHRRTNPQFEEAKYRQESVIETIRVPMAEPLMLELGHFADCIIQGKTPYVPGEDGLRALRLAQGVSDQISNLMVLDDVMPPAA